MSILHSIFVYNLRYSHRSPVKTRKKRQNIYNPKKYYLPITITESIQQNQAPPIHPTHPLSPCPDRVYIAWLSLVTLAFNYNMWFSTARLCFPYHTAEAIPYWFLLDSLADLVYLLDCILFQPRRQFVKGGDVIVSQVSEPGENYLF